MEQRGLEVRAGGTPTGGPCSGFDLPCVEGEPAEGGRIVFGVVGSDQLEPAEDSLDPASLLYDPAARLAGQAIYDPLITYDASGRYAPSLATRWENTPDFRTWTLTLRSGVVFHDHTTFDAEAVVRHFNRLRDPGNNCVCAPEIAPIASVEALDATTVRFNLHETDADFVNLLAGPVGYIASPAATDRWGADYGHHPVGTGPFLLDGFDSRVEPLILEKNRDYWDTDDQGRRLPYLDQVTLRPIFDGSGPMAALEAGDIDVLQTFDEGVIHAAEQSGRWGVQKATYAELVGLFNDTRPPFDDVRTRRAVAHGLDRDEMNRAVSGGVAQRGLGLFPPGSPYYGADIEWPDYDPQKARQLVEEVERSGDELTFSFTCFPLSETYRVALDNIQTQLADVGIDTQPRYVDQGENVNLLLGGDRDYQMAFWRRGGVVGEFLYREFESGSEINLLRYSNTAVDRVIQDLRRTTDHDERRRLLHTMEEQIAEDVPMLPLWHDVSANVYSPAISGLSLPEPEIPGAIKLATLYRRR